jgi:chaperonin GroES
MAITPLFDRIVVKRAEGEAKSAGGIFLPDAAQEKRQEGTVVAAGAGRLLEDGTLIPLDIKGGERVLFGKYAGSEVKYGGETYLIMREEEVLAVLED